MYTPALSPKFAIVTSASRGLGFELADCCAAAGYDLLVVSDEPDVVGVALDLRRRGHTVEALRADLTTPTGIDALYAAVRGRPVDALVANAGLGLGRALHDERRRGMRCVIDASVTSTLGLIYRIGRDMSARGVGKILISGAIEGVTGTHEALYDGARALLGSFARVLRAELHGSGVSVTCAITGLPQIDLAGPADKPDPRAGAFDERWSNRVARAGFDAMVRGDV